MFIEDFYKKKDINITNNNDTNSSCGKPQTALVNNKTNKKKLTKNSPVGSLLTLMVNNMKQIHFVTIKCICTCSNQSDVNKIKLQINNSVK